jgi:hypothetical protein
MVKNRHECDAGIPSNAEGDPRGYDVEYCAIDVEQEHWETGKEEEKGKMDKNGYCPGHPVQVQLLESLCVVSTNSCPVACTVSSLSGVKVGKSPLLNEYRKESPCKAHRDAQEPERVNHDCGCLWREWRWVKRNGIDDGLGTGGIGE